MFSVRLSVRRRYGQAEARLARVGPPVSSFVNGRRPLHALPFIRVSLCLRAERILAVRTTASVSALPSRLWVQNNRFLHVVQVPDSIGFSLFSVDKFPR